MTLALAVLLIACSSKQQTETKDMNQLSFTPEQAAWMSAIVCDEAKGDMVSRTNGSNPLATRNTIN